MAYRKKSSRKNYRRKTSTPNYTIDGSVAHLAKRAMEGVKYVKNMLNVEYKYKDNSVITSTFDYSGTTGNVVTVTQGASGSQRNGDSLKLTSLLFNYSTYITASTAAQCRVILCRGNNERGTAPTLAQLLAVTGSAQVINSPRLVDPESMYTVLFDQKFTLNADKPSLNRSIFKKLDHHVKYTAGTSTPLMGGLYYFFVSDITGANSPTFNLYSRIRYVDN